MMSSSLMLLNALRIALSKVVISVVNIFIFRNIYGIAGKHVHGFYAFIITVFLVGKIKTYWSRLIESVFTKVKFDPTRFSRLDVTDPPRDFYHKATASFHTDLFSYIFGSASQSSVINLFVIIAIEQLCSSYGFSIYKSMLYCVGVAFFILFGSSWSYMSLLYEDWNKYVEKLDAGDVTNRKHAVLYGQDLVCLVDSNLNMQNKEISIEFKYLSAKYVNHVSDLVDYYVKNHVNLPKEENTDMDAAQPQVMAFGFIENYSFIVPDYFDQNFSMSSTLRKYKFRRTEGWTEYNMFVWVGMEKSIYKNRSDKKKKQ